LLAQHLDAIIWGGGRKMVRLAAVPLGMLVVVFAMAACEGPAPPPSSSEASPSSPTVSPSAGVTGEIVDLPAPRTDSDVSLEEALATRRSAREFTDEPLTTQQISQLLWAAQGITADWGGRTAPSAGALYPLEVYVATREGLYHYLPEGHRLQILGRTDLRAPLADAALGQTAVSDAPTVFVIAAVYARTAEKYEDRAERYVQLEAGHACQNLLLEAVALGLGAVPMGSFSDAEVARTLGLPTGQTPLYLVPVGHSAEEPG
jgi:SagB-type dehydrogenase family enzyme